MTAEAPPTAPPSSPPDKRPRPRKIIGVGVFLVFVAAYALSLFGVDLLQKSEGPLPPLDLSQAGPDDTVVQIRLQELKPTTNRLTVNVIIYPGESLYDKRFDELNTDIAVRLYPPNDLGDLVFPKGKAPAQVTTTIEAHGDPGSWPFDSYRTEPQSADVFVGTGANRNRTPPSSRPRERWTAGTPTSGAIPTSAKPEATTTATWSSPCIGPRAR